MTPQERLAEIDAIVTRLGVLRADIVGDAAPQWKIVGTAAKLDALCQQSHQRIRIVGTLTVNQRIHVRGRDIVINGDGGGELAGTGGGTADGKALTVFQLAPEVDGFTLEKCRINCEQKTTVVRVQGNGVRGSGAKNATLADNTVKRCGSLLVSEAGGGTGITLSGNEYPSGGFIGSRATWCEGVNITIEAERFEAACPNEQAYRFNNCANVRIDDCVFRDDPNKQTLAVQWCEGARISNTEVRGGRLELGPLSSVDAVGPGGAWKEPNAVCRDVLVDGCSWDWCDIIAGSHDIAFTNCTGPEPRLKIGSGLGLPARTHKAIRFNGKVLA